MLTLITAMVLILMIFTPWWSKLTYYAEQQQMLAERLVTYNRILRQKPQLEERLSVVTARLNSSDLYFRSATAELAGAELQRRISTLVDSTDAKLISTQNLGVSKEAGPTKITVRVRLSGDMEALSKILYELESQPPVTIIQNLSMRGKRVPVRRRNRQLAALHSIDINFDLIGFLRLRDQ